MVDFPQDIGFAASPGIGNFGIDPGKQLLQHVVRRDQQLFKVHLFFGMADEIEDRINLAGNPAIGGQQGHIGVQFGIPFMEVSGTHTDHIPFR